MKTTPTILVVTCGGTEKFPPNKFDYIFTLLKKLAQQGFKIVVVDSVKIDAPICEIIDNIEIVRLRTFPQTFSQEKRFFPLIYYLLLLLNRFTYALSINKLVKSKKPDILYTIPTTVTWLLLFLNPSLRHKTVYHSINAFRTGQNQGFLTFLYKKIEDQIIKTVPYTITENNHVKNIILQQTNVNPEKLFLLEPIIDISFWNSAQVSQTLGELFTHQGFISLLYHGRIIPRKGIDYLIKAMNILVNKRGYNNVRLFIVGSGEYNYLKRLQLLISTYNLQDFIRIIFGWQPEEYIREYYMKCDIYVFPTLSDLSPNTIRQAIAMGKPVVTTTILKGFLITDGEDGFLVPPANETELADKLEMLIISPDLREKMSAKAREKAVRIFNVDLASERLKSLLLAMLNQHAG